ncbi:uncharacterized protein LOC127701543 isoform X5 [Mytilus californianus]|uniref:uncharacterized protein LOC127701543 isoform X5 n=1 Tax=Mytilus californianus TaxID=6549 RepID=UPI002247A31E|nr:uncharacterized protein LOC127701543 isoform X5 [Mytilus californianus]
MNRDNDDTITSTETTHWKNTSDQNWLPLETDEEIQLKSPTCKENRSIGEDENKTKCNTRNEGQEVKPVHCDQNQDQILSELINDEQLISTNSKQERNNSKEIIYSKPGVQQADSSADIQQAGNSTNVQQAGNSTKVQHAITRIDVQLAGKSTDVQQAGKSTDVQQSSNSTDVQQAGNSTNIQQTGNSTDYQLTGNSTDVQQANNSTDVQQANNSTDVQQAITGIDVQQAGSSTDVQQADIITDVQRADNGTDLQQADNSTDVQQTGNSTDFQQTGNSTEIQQAGNSTDVQLAGNSSDVQQAHNSTDVKQENNSTDVQQANNSTDFQQANYSTDVQQAGNGTDIQQAGISTDIQQAGNSTDVQQAGNSTGVQQAHNSTDVKQENNSTDVQQANNSSDVHQAIIGIDAQQTGHSTDVQQAGNSTAIQQAGNSTDVQQVGNSTDVQQAGNSNDVQQAGNSTDVEQAGNSNDVQQANKQVGNIQQQSFQSQTLQQQQNDGEDLQLKPIISIDNHLQLSNNQQEPTNAIDFQEQLVNTNSIQQQLLDNTNIQPQHNDNSCTKQQPIENSNAKQQPIGNSDILEQSSYTSNTIQQSSDLNDTQQQPGNNSNNQQQPNDKNNTKQQSNDKNCTSQQPRDEIIAQQQPNDSSNAKQQPSNNKKIQQQPNNNSNIQQHPTDNIDIEQPSCRISDIKQPKNTVQDGQKIMLTGFQDSDILKETIEKDNEKLMIITTDDHDRDNRNTQQQLDEQHDDTKNIQQDGLISVQHDDTNDSQQQFHTSEQPCDTENNKSKCHTSEQPCGTENNKPQCHTSEPPCGTENNKPQCHTSEPPCDTKNNNPQCHNSEQPCDTKNNKPQCHTSEQPCDTENNKPQCHNSEQPCDTKNKKTQCHTNEQPFDAKNNQQQCYTNEQPCDAKNNRQQCHSTKQPCDAKNNKAQCHTLEQPSDTKDNQQQCHNTKHPFDAKNNQQQCHTSNHPCNAKNNKVQCHTLEQPSDSKDNQHQCFVSEENSDTKVNQQLSQTSKAESDLRNRQLQCSPKKQLNDSKDSMQQTSSTEKHSTLLGKLNARAKDNIKSFKTVEQHMEDPNQKDIKVIEEYYNSNQELPIDLSNPNKKSNSNNGFLLAPKQVKKHTESMASSIHSHSNYPDDRMQQSHDEKSYLKNIIHHSKMKDGLQSITIPNSKKSDNLLHIPKRKAHRNRQKYCDIRDMQELYKTYQQEDVSNFHEFKVQGKDVHFLHSPNEQFGKIQDNLQQKTSGGDYCVMRQLSHPSKQEVVMDTEYSGSSGQQSDSNSENKHQIVTYQRQQSESSENSLQIIMDQSTSIGHSESTSSENSLQIATDHTEFEKLVFPVKLEIDERVTSESEIEHPTNQQSEHGTEGGIQDDIAHKENISILFVCNTCLREKMTTATFPNGQTLARHAILVHHPLPNLTGPYFQFTCHTEDFNYYCIPVVQEKLYPCKFGNCTETYTCARLLRNHVSEHHTKRQLVFDYKKCQYRHCERLFSSQESRKQHVREFHIDHSIKREDGYGALWIIKSSPNDKLGNKQGMHKNERIHENCFQEIRNFFVEVYEVTRIIVSSGDYFVSFCENCAYYDAPRDFDVLKYGKLCKDEKQCDVSYVCREIKSAYGDFIVDINNVKSRMLNSGVLFHDFHFGCCIFIDDVETRSEIKEDNGEKSMDSEIDIPILKKIKPTKNELQKSISENIKPKDVEADIGDLVFLYGKPNPNYSPACPETVEDNLDSPEGEIIYHDENDQDNYAVLSCDAFPSELNSSAEPAEEDIDRKNVIKVESYWEEFGDDSIKRSLNISTDDQTVNRSMKPEPINEEMVLTENVKQEKVNSGKTKSDKIRSSKSSKKGGSKNMKKPSQTEENKVHTWKEEEIGSCISIPDSHLVTSDFLSEISENFIDSGLNVVEDTYSKVQKSSDVICDTLEGGSTSIKKDPKSQKSLNKDSKSQKCFIEDSKSQKCLNIPSSGGSAFKRSLSVPPGDKSVKQREKKQKINDKQNKFSSKCSSSSEQNSAKEEKKETFSKKPYGSLLNIEGIKTNKKSKITGRYSYGDVIAIKVDKSGRNQSQRLLLDETQKSHLKNQIDDTDDDDDIIELDIGSTSKVKLNRSQSENDISKNVHHDIIEIDVDHNHKNSHSRNVYKDDIIVIDTGENLEDMHNIKGHSNDNPVHLHKRKRHSNDKTDLDIGDNIRKSYNESRMSLHNSNLNNGKNKSTKTLKSHDEVIQIDNDDDVMSHDLYTNHKKLKKDEMLDDSDDTDDYTHEEYSVQSPSDFKTKKDSSIKFKEKNWKLSDKTDCQNRKFLDSKRKQVDKSNHKIDHTKKKSQPFQQKKKFCEWKFPKKTNLSSSKVKKETNSVIELNSMQNVCDNIKSESFQKHLSHGESLVNEEGTVNENGSDLKHEKEKWVVEGHEIKDCKIKVFKLDDSDVDYVCQELKSGHKTNYANYLYSMQKLDARNFDQLMNGCLKLDMKPRRLKRIVEICKKLFEMNKYFHDNPHKRIECSRKRKSNSFRPNGELKKRKSDNNVLEFVDLDWIMDSDDSVSISEDDDEDTDFDDLDFTDNDLFCPEPGCTKRFASSVTLEHHIARKHDDQLYEERKFCPVESCERSYSNKHNLMTHIKKDHGEVVYNEIRSELYGVKPEPESAMVRPAGTCLMPTVWRNPLHLIPSHVKEKMSKTSTTEPPKNVKEVEDIKNILSDFTQTGRGSSYSILSNK